MTVTFNDPNMANKLRSPGEIPTLRLQFDSTYRLDSSKVDVDLARKLYYNTDNRYKLGAGFSRPAINVPTGFMGVPRLLAEDPSSEAQIWLDRHTKAWAGDIIQAHKMALRDGEVLVRLRPKNRAPAFRELFASDEKDLELGLVPSEAFEIISKDEDLDAMEAIKVKHVFPVNDENGITQTVTLWEMVTAEQIILEYENDFRPKRVLPNPLGFVPAIHLENEPERHQLRGSSDLEPIEPYMKFYNDVMLHAGSASELHSTAKLIIRVQDLERFLNNNFGEAEINEGRLRFKNKDVMFFESGQPAVNVSGSSIYTEGAEIVQAEAPLGDTTTLLEFIFLNIVDVSEVPEWAFGGAIASSKASVSEQSAPLVHKVNRKRTMYEGSWKLAGRMMLKQIMGQAQRVDAEWDNLAMRDLKTEAEAFRNFSESLLALNDGQVVSKVTMNEVLRKLLPEILPFDVDDEVIERDRISAEVAEKVEQAQELFDRKREQLEDEDRENGLRVVGGDSSTNAAGSGAG